MAILSVLLLHSQASAQNPPFLLQWGSQGSGDGQFGFGLASSLTVDGGGNVFVVDASANRVQKFDNDGNFLLKWGSFGSGNGQFVEPRAIAVDNLGFVYVADGVRVQKFSSTGVFVTTWGSYGTGDGQIEDCFGLASDYAGSIYLNDYNNARVQKFTDTGTFLTKWGSIAVFGSLTGIAVEPAGTVLVANCCSTPTAEVERFSSTGQFLFAFGSSGSGDGQFDNPNQIATDGNGNIYVADWGNNRVQVFTSAGALGAIWYGSSGVPFSGPMGVAVDGGGSVFVLDQHNHRIVKFGPVTATRATSWGKLKSIYR